MKHMKSKPVIDNYSIALIGRLNELAARFGIEPYEYVVTFDSSAAGPHVLRFESPPPLSKDVAFGRMLELLGIGDDRHTVEIEGSEEEIWQTVQNALARAPSARARS